ncbi:uncharacterized protein LOC129744318 [Uranotaenia lowii]|uniref:uncharacterized protein LOC129744318 n=1 Tax=Uranotaenia lowii TaxID=190385 RepID=UPI002479457D|nr:uncharacterized protein LOC129744318 [Uranotaenia lowii]
MWTREKILRLIKDYRDTPCLWDVSSPEYKVKRNRREARIALAAKHNVTVDQIEKKIHNLKTSFNRERKKCLEKSRESPWFAYNYLYFLQPSYESKDGLKVEFPVVPDEDDMIEHDPDYEEYPAQKPVKYMHSLSEVPGPSRDEISVFGEYVTNKMRNCSRPRAEVCLAQRHINDILFKLDMGLLAEEIPAIKRPAAAISIVSRDSYFHNYSSPKTDDIEVADSME